MNAFKPILVITIAVIASAALAGDASHGSIDLPKGREFQVLAAQWGTGHRWVDVTEIACALSTEAGLDVAAVRTHFGDPYPHFKKALVVFYSWRGELYSATAHENGRLRIPVRDQAVMARRVQKAAERRLAAIAKEFEAGSQAANLLLEDALAVGSIDGIKKAIRKGWKLAREAQGRLSPMFVAFRTFLERHPSLAKDPGLAEIREQAAVIKAQFESWAEQCHAAKKGMHEVTAKVESTTDWRDLKLTIGKGDLVAFAAEGTWQLGHYAGSCDAAGFAGDRYAIHSPLPELPHGCLLVRLGTDVFAEGKQTGHARATEGGIQVQARVNDDTYHDNIGAISVRVLVVPVRAAPR